MLRAIAKYTEDCNGDQPKIVKKYEDYVKRELTEDELDTISDFVNGY